MTEMEKALKIIEQVSKLDMDQMPLFTWDEMEEEKAKNEGLNGWSVLLGALLGFMAGILYYETFLKK